MSSSLPNNKLMDAALLGEWMADQPYLWHMKPLQADELERLTGTSGFKLGFWRNGIEQLWQLGFLKADLVEARAKHNTRGLKDLGVSKFEYQLYADIRRLRVRRMGYWGAAAQIKPLGNVRLLFHPFRYFVLVLLEKQLTSMISHMQYLHGRKSYYEITKWDMKRFRDLSSSVSFVQNIEHWNDIVALIVALEPCFSQRLSGGKVSIPSELVAFEQGGTDIEQRLDQAYARLLGEIDNHWARIEPILHGIGLAKLEDIRQEICIQSQLLDPNKELHTLLRLERGDRRFDLRGHIGGAVYLNAMAEMLRRACERAFNIQLPEEDERGFGQTFQETKIQLYGSDRITDRNPDVAAAFIRHFGLDYRPSLRWYLEGPTEYHAVNEIITAFGATSSIGLVDLGGQFAANRLLLFRGDLESDKERHIFSYVSLDGGKNKNEKNNVKLVKQAAKDGKLLGRIFISEPDFEFANFELHELEEVLWALAEEERLKSAQEEDLSAAQANTHVVGLPATADASTQREALHNVISTADNAKALIEAAKGALAVLNHLRKGKDWGIALIRYAWANRTWREGQTRPIVMAIESAMRLRTSNYNIISNQYQTDPESGMLVPKTPSNAKDQA